jgi:hypothetical protein
MPLRGRLNTNSHQEHREKITVTLRGEGTDSKGVTTVATAKNKGVNYGFTCSVENIQRYRVRKKMVMIQLVTPLAWR